MLSIYVCPQLRLLKHLNDIHEKCNERDAIVERPTDTIFNFLKSGMRTRHTCRREICGALLALNLGNEMVYGNTLVTNVHLFRDYFGVVIICLVKAYIATL